MNLSGYTDGYRRYLETATKLSAGSRREYAKAVAAFVAAVNDPTLSLVTPQTLLDWHSRMTDTGKAPGTFGLRHAALTSFLDYILEFHGDEHAGRLLRALRRLRTPKNTPLKRVPYALGPEDVAALLLGASTPYGTLGVRSRAVVHLLLSTGMRRAEIARLSIDRLDLNQRTATITGKGDKVRAVVFDDACRTDLAAWIRMRAAWPQKDGVHAVFLTATGDAMTPELVYSILKDAAKAAKLKRPIWTHITRHTFVTDMNDRGAPLTAISQLAGHTDPKTTMGYLHTDPSKLKEEYDKAKNRVEGAKGV